MDATPPQRSGAPAPGAPSSRTAGGPPLTALAGYVLALLCVVLIAGLFPRAAGGLAQATGPQERSRSVLREVDHLLSLVRTVEARQRDYLLLREEPSRTAYEEARRSIGTSIEHLRALTPENSPARERLDPLALLVQRRLTSLERPLALMRAGKPDAALQAQREEIRTPQADELERFARTWREEEERRSEERLPQEQAASGRTSLVVLGGCGFLFAFLGFSAFQTLRRARAGGERRSGSAEEPTQLSPPGRTGEDEARRSRAQRILQHLPAAVGLFRASDRRCELANVALMRLHGGRDLVGLTAAEIHTAPLGGPLLELFDKVLGTGQPSTASGHRLVLERSSLERPPERSSESRRTEFFVNITYQPLLDARGQVEAVLLFAVEVTEQIAARRTAEEALAQRQRSEGALRESEALAQRQRSEGALRESEAHLRRILKDSDVSTWEADLRTRRMVWSSQVEAMSGVVGLAAPSPPATLEALLAVVHPEDRGMLAQRLSSSAQDAGEFRLEYRVMLADGGVRWHESRVRVVLDPAGQPAKLVAVLLDITARRLAERAQRESEGRFRLLTENVPEFVWTSGVDGAAEDFNPRWYEYTGQTPEQARGDGWMRALHPDDVAPTLALTRRAITTGEPLNAEYRLRRGSDGAYRWFSSRASLLRDAAGTGTQWVGTSLDIDEQRYDARLQRFLSEVSGVLASAGDPTAALQQVARLAAAQLTDWCIVDLMDEEGGMERVEVAHADPSLTGLADTLRRYPPINRATHPSTQAARTHQTVYLPEVTSTHLERMTHDAEHLRAVLALKVRSLVAVPLLARERTLGVVAFLTTALSGRRYERNDMLRLEQVVHRAALALDNARLFSLARAERERADQSNRLKDEFLATVSHELRTPLTAMIGWLKLLRDGRLPPAKHARALETVDRNAHAQAQLIEDLLDVSRIVSGKLHLEPQPVHLAGVIHAALDSVRPAAEAKGMRLHAEVDPHEDVVMGDAARLQQVVWNLLSNAVKFSPGEHSVWVKLRSVGSGVELTVEDEGPGIPEAFLPHLFERFRRVEGGSTRQHGGLGLGLSIVRHLVELHGGTVHATSGAPGRGALFTVRLPRGVITPVSESEGSAALPATWPALAHRRVLVVDDEEDSREMLRLTLEGHGAHVTTAASAAEALRLLLAERPELLVSDIGMPGEDGYALITRVRALSASDGGTIAAVALTAYARVEDRARALTAGFDMHVSKPVEPDELLSVLSNLVALSPHG